MNPVDSPKALLKSFLFKILNIRRCFNIKVLHSGNDIANLGMIPQDFDLFVYERSNDNTDNVNGVKARSTTSTNAFEKVSFTSSADYLLFRIKLYSDDARSENNGQIVLGFDLAASN